MPNQKLRATLVALTIGGAAFLTWPAGSQSAPPTQAPAAQAAPAPGGKPPSPVQPSLGPPASLEPRIVKPRDIIVISASRFRVGNERYQVFGVRAPRPRAGQCVMERLRGRQARATLRRILSRGEIRIAPTGQINRDGYKLARVTVDGTSVRRRLLDARAALPRRGNESFNPWCISLRKPPA